MRLFAKRNRWLIAGTMAAVAALSLTACAPSSNAPEIAALELHPTGPEGAWLRDGYVNGSTESVTAEGSLCSLRDGVAVSTLPGASMRATSIATGEVLWERDRAICLDLGGNGEYGLVASTWVAADDGTEIPHNEVIDPSTGETLEVVPLPFNVGMVAVAQVDDITIYLANKLLVAMRDGEKVWQTTITATGLPIVLGDGMIGVNDITTGTVTFIDGATGTTTSIVKPDAGRFEWATDGAVLLADDDPSTPNSWVPKDSKYRLVDVAGQENGTIPADTSPSLVPSFRDGVTMTLADRAAAPTVFAVTRDGSPALFQDALGDMLTPTGPFPVDVKPDALAGVSADGSVFVIDGPGNAVTLITASGEVLELGPVAKGSDVSVRDGYIVVQTGSSTRVFLPNKE